MVPEIALLPDIEKKELTKDPRTEEFYNIIAKIGKRLNNNTLVKREPPQSSSSTRRTIYEILFEYPQEEIDAEIALLPDIEQKELAKGEHTEYFYRIKRKIEQSLALKLKNMKTKIILPKQEPRQELKEKKMKPKRTIYEILKDYSKEEIDAAARPYRKRNCQQAC